MDNLKKVIYEKNKLPSIDMLLKLLNFGINDNEISKEEIYEQFKNYIESTEYCQILDFLSPVEIIEKFINDSDLCL